MTTMLMHDATTRVSPYTNSLEIIRHLVVDDFIAVDALILQSLHTSVELIQQIGHHIIHSGGKRLRPLLALISARVFAYHGDAHIKIAAIIEFIHTATLLHDDVIDASSMRRGKKTANAIWGNQASVLVGDFLYSRAFQMMTQLQNLPVMQVMADTTNQIAEGEVLQLINRNDPNTSEARYLEVIRRKTATLFSAATQLGAIIAGGSLQEQEAMANYGLHLGMAFQLIDDLLDYTASPAETGKNIGDDLAEGKPTLPLIYAMNAGSSHQAQLIREAIVKGGLAELTLILDAIKSTQAIEYIKEMAQEQADLAKSFLHSLPDTSYREALLSLAQFAVNRTS